MAGYRLEELLGRGGMSVVYLAEQIRLGRKVALKLLAPALAEDEGFRERFERESRRAAEIDHPNIIPIYDAGEADGELYIAMRYVKGGDLKSAIEREGALGVGRTLFLLEQAASALDGAHARELIHRDVKPANILIEEPSERVYLTDFGIVKHAASRGLTRTGLFIGSVDYAAPEQIEGLPVDARTDVYALGCVLYQCLTGRAPFEREGEVAVLHAHLTEPPPAVTRTRPDLPEALDHVIATAMAKSRDERYPSCGALIRAARAAVLQQPAAVAPAPVAQGDEVPAAAAPGTSRHPTREQERRLAPPRWLLTLALATVAAAVAGVVVYLLVRPESSPPVAAAGETATTSAGATTPAGTTPAAESSGLSALVPGPLWRDCAPTDTDVFGATASAVCRPTAATNPDRWELTLFDDADSLKAAYVDIRLSQGFSEYEGDCDETTWQGEGEWDHASGTLGGRHLCTFEGNDAIIVWTHDKRGRDDVENVLGIARESSGDSGRLYDWWRSWNERIGAHPAQ